MYVRRGRADTVAADSEVTDAVVARAARERAPTLRVWRPHRQVAFGRRDSSADGYELAREAAEERGFPATTREVGGRAVAFTGTTVAFVHAIPVDGVRGGIETRYDDASAALRAALSTLGVETTEGEPPKSFCPGTHSLQALTPRGPGKVAGLGQRVTGEVATVAGVVVVAERDSFCRVLSPVYDRLDVPFDPAAVGSLTAAGAFEADPDTVADRTVDAIVDAIA